MATPANSLQGVPAGCVLVRTVCNVEKRVPVCLVVCTRNYYFSATASGVL